MRTHGFRLYAIVSMLALLFGAQVCMVVQCAPEKADSQAHGCCTKSGEQDPPPPPYASAKPCCIQVTIAAVPELQPPAALEFHSLAAVLLAAQQAATAPVASTASPPGDEPAPNLAPPLFAAGSRAPPASA